MPPRAIGGIVFDCVTVTSRVDQMVMRIDDPTVRFKDLFRDLVSYLVSPLIMAAAFSPIMIAGACNAALGIRGMIDVSAIRSPSIPRTFRSGVTTELSVEPIAQVPH